MVTTEDLEIVEKELSLPRLPKEFDHYRVGFITDIHLGIATSEDFVASAVATVTAKNVDLLLLGGDYLWIAESSLGAYLQPIKNPSFKAIRSNERLAAHICQRFVSMLPRNEVPDGIFAVYGNHDRWINPVACEESFREGPVTLLVNQGVEIKRRESSLLLLGVDDYLTGVPVFSLPDRDLPGATLLLCHNPDYLAFLSKAGRLNAVDLALCGHTHGGQIKLPLLGALVANIRNERFREGLVQENNTLVYTSRGVGVVELAVRINCKPEVTILTLRCES
jgi:predicted MPP superfamily phosphohydrolase